jgi:hypothetical protein
MLANLMCHARANPSDERRPGACSPRCPIWRASFAAASTLIPQTLNRRTFVLALESAAEILIEPQITEGLRP